MNGSCFDGPAWIKEFPLNPGFSLLLSFDVNRTPGTGPTLMDPNRLPMEQGKLFFKQLGIPQRDIDLMTEEGVVVTSVEVMLWFPLMPGEDPAACCVLNKKHQLSKTRSPAPERLSFVSCPV
ncbi:uncharacterized protein [Manis javanica]|uniref:uncharacterized protein n=1 Tax=Manis javanica TaxID=9974 RepID=UPI003C6CF361